MSAFIMADMHKKEFNCVGLKLAVEFELHIKTVSLSIFGDQTQLVSLSDEVHLCQQVEWDLVFKCGRSNMTSW